MIKTLAAGSGTLLIPGFSILNYFNKPIQIFVVGFLYTGLYEEFSKFNSDIQITKIACEFNSTFKVRTKKYNLDLPTMSYDMEKELSYESIAEKLIPDRKYVFVIDFSKRLIEPSIQLIQWANEKRIDFRFLGVSTVLYPSYIEKSIAAFSKYDNSRIKVFDTKPLLEKFRYQTLNEAFDYIEPLITDELEKMCCN